MVCFLLWRLACIFRSSKITLHQNQKIKNNPSSKSKNQKSKIKNQKSKNQKSKIKNKIKNQKSKIKNKFIELGLCPTMRWKKPRRRGCEENVGAGPWPWGLVRSKRIVTG